MNDENMKNKKIVQIAKGKKKTVVFDISGSHGSFDIVVDENAKADIVLFAKGKRNIDATVSVILAGRFAEAQIMGCIIGTQEQIISLKTYQHHKAPDTTSNLLVKSVLSEKATFTCDGAIRVEKKAQKTNAYQRNENLLLSEETHAESNPSLEILANDVRCTHGATIGSVSTDALWYMATRGIGEHNGTRLIAQGFLLSPLERLENQNVKKKLQQFVLRAV